MHVEHLHRGELFQHGARRQTRRQIPKASVQRDLQTVSQERNENVCLDPMFQLVVNRTSSFKFLKAASTS